MPETIDLMADNNGLTAEDNSTSYGFVHFAVMGNPQAQKRARRGRYGFYSPNKKVVAAFQAQVKLALPGTEHEPIFGGQPPRKVRIHCFMKRPNKDFTRCNRLLGALKSMVPLVRPIKPAIDSLAKFVLDALKNLVYFDDKQVVQLSVYKVLDNDGSCEGKIVIKISPHFTWNMEE